MYYLSRDPLKTGKGAETGEENEHKGGEMRKNKQGENKRRKAERRGSCLWAEKTWAVILFPLWVHNNSAVCLSC